MKGSLNVADLVAYYCRSYSNRCGKCRRTLTDGTAVGSVWPKRARNEDGETWELSQTQQAEKNDT